MMMYKFLEEVEAPSLKDNEWHYVPNIFLIQKKITYENQIRLSYCRSNMRVRRRIITVKNYENKTLPKIEDEKNILEDEMQMVTMEEDFHSLASFSTKQIEEQTNYNVLDGDYFLGKIEMDHCKVFENFMKGSNLPVVAANYERSCQKKSYRKRIRTTVMIKPGTFLANLLEKERISKGLRRRTQLKYNS